MAPIANTSTARFRTSRRCSSPTCRRSSTIPKCWCSACAIAASRSTSTARATNARSSIWSATCRIRRPTTCRASAGKYGKEAQPMSAFAPATDATHAMPQAPESRPRSLDFAGWLMYATALVWIALLLPADAFQPGSANYVLAIGALGVWRYSLRVIHFVRGMLFLHREYPRLRREVEALGEAAAPSHVYLMVTSFRIDALTTAEVYRATIEEGMRCGWPCTVIASIVAMSDERIVLRSEERRVGKECVSTGGSRCARYIEK